MLSRVWLFVMPWTVAYQAPQSMNLQAKILEWVAISFSRGSSQPRDQSWVSWIVDRCFTVWTTREIPKRLWTSETLHISCFTRASPNHLFLQMHSRVMILNYTSWKSSFLPFCKVRSKNLESVMLSEVIWPRRSIVCGIKKETIQMNFLTKQKETHRLQERVYGCWGKHGGKR